MDSMDIEKTIRSLKSRKFEVSHFSTAEDASDYLIGSIKDTTVGIGGSVTVDELNIYEKLLVSNKDVAWHWKDSSEDVLSRAAKASVYISSANALSETGELILIDGKGNRVSSVINGMNKTVYIVASTNKICPDLESAIFRARNVAAPQNVKRILPECAKNPCLKYGKCFDCRVEERICNAMLILMCKMNASIKYEVVLVDEPLGY